MARKEAIHGGKKEVGPEDIMGRVGRVLKAFPETRYAIDSPYRFLLLGAPRFDEGGNMLQVFEYAPASKETPISSAKLREGTGDIIYQVDNVTRVWIEEEVVHVEGDSDRLVTRMHVRWDGWSAQERIPKHVQVEIFSGKQVKKVPRVSTKPEEMGHTA